jgi:mannose-6-phosphate isomerase
MNTPKHTDLALYPLRFEPIYQYRLWGGRRRADFLRTCDGLIGEAWLLNCREDCRSVVAVGPLKGRPPMSRNA